MAINKNGHKSHGVLPNIGDGDVLARPDTEKWRNWRYKRILHVWCQVCVRNINRNCFAWLSGFVPVLFNDNYWFRQYSLGRETKWIMNWKQSDPSHIWSMLMAFAWRYLRVPQSPQSGWPVSRHNIFALLIISAKQWTLWI